MLGWRPVYGHPAGPSDRPWFLVTDERHAYPSEHHPAGGPSTLPWYTVHDTLVFPAAGHPDGPSVEATFEIIGSFLYLTRPVSNGERAPWYQLTALP
jgi:hypothetical protein